MFRKLIVIILALTLFIAGCGKATRETTGNQSPEPKPVKLGVLPIEDNLPLYVAEADKLFAKNGLQVELVPFDSARDRDMALQAGKIDGEVADLVAVALLKKGGADVRVAAIGLGAKPAEGRFALLAAPKGKVRAVSDLKNVPVAISENTIIEYVADNLLLAGGVKKQEIKKVAIPSIPARMEALSGGQIEAAILPDPMASLAQKQGARLITDDTKINLSQTVLLFRKQVIDENRAAAAKVVEIYGQAGQELTANPEKYRTLFIEKARVPAPLKDTYNSPTFSPIQLPTKEQVSRVIDWMVDKKLLEKPFTYDEIVDSSLIRK